MGLLRTWCSASVTCFANLIIFLCYIDQSILSFGLLLLLAPFFITHLLFAEFPQRINPDPAPSSTSSPSSQSPSRSRALFLWRLAFRRVRRGLLLRRLWAHLGIYLQSSEQRALWSGLRRRGGSLYRASHHGSVAPALRSRRHASAAATRLR